MSKATTIVTRLLEDEGEFGGEIGQPKTQRLSTEELQEIWQDDEHGEYIQIDDDDVARYIAHGRAMEQIPPAYGNIWAGIRQWMKAKNFFPNIWSVNERGNVTLRDVRGNDLGGLV